MASGVEMPRRSLRAQPATVSAERAAFWGMTDLTRQQVTEIYEHLTGLDTHHAFLVRKDLVDSGRFRGPADLKGMVFGTTPPINASAAYPPLERK